MKDVVSAEKPTHIFPQVEYERRRAARQEEVLRQERRDRLASHVRLVTFLAGCGVAYLALRPGYLSLAWLLPVGACFVGAVGWHWRVLRSLERARRAVEYYDRGLARLNDRWCGSGITGAQYGRPEHPYAMDLDLFGRGSLFELLSSARTQAGQDVLSAWLLAPADVEMIRSRQAAVEEMRGRLDLREELGVLSGPIRMNADPQALRRWMAAPALLVDRIRPVLAAVLAVAAIATLTGWLLGLTRPWPLAAVALLQAVLLVQMRLPMNELTRTLDQVLAELNLLAGVLRIVEGQQFDGSYLQELVGRLRAGGRPASRRIAQLVRLANHWETVRRNQFVAPLAFILMLYVLLAYRIERWRTDHRQRATQWIQVVGEFEALCSLSGYAYEHPQHPFPEIAAAGPIVDAQGLGHPLIPALKRVSNDVQLGPEHRLLLVSGSNMSGKSTLLRTVGVNVVLALAGAPVCADRMRVSRLAAACAMRHVDSLQAGVSAFYAEIQRLRAISDLASESPPVLFLLDEILHGTNSHDRRIGAEAAIEDLLRRGAIGLVTTHDLALAEIADRLTPRAANVHFEDQLIEGRIHFDYRLRPGVVPKGNGLALMRLLGFDVSDAP